MSLLFLNVFRAYSCKFAVMKQVVLQVQEDKYQFFMELLKNFDFVNVQKEQEAKKQLIKQIAEGMNGAVLAAKGKIKSKPAKDFLNEL